MDSRFRGNDGFPVQRIIGAGGYSPIIPVPPSFPRKRESRGRPLSLQVVVGGQGGGDAVAYGGA